MATLAKLMVELGLDDKMSGGLDKAGKNLKSWGTKLTGAVTLPVAAGFAFAIKSASDLNEAVSATQTVFGATSKSIIAFSDTTADAFGISKAEALDSATTLGQLAMGVGIATDEAGKMGIAMISAAGDLASFRNADPSDVLADIQSGLVGQYEPLLKYGIVLNEAIVAQKAMEMTGKASADQLTNADKVLARSTLITEGLGAAQGDAARTSNGLANIVRRLKARGQDLAAKWGQILLPMVLKLADFLIKLADRFEGLSPKAQKFIIIGLAIAAVIGPLLVVIGMLLPALSAIGAVLGILLGPIGLIILAIVALGVAYKTNFLGFADAVNWAAEKVGEFIEWIQKAIDEGKSFSEIVGMMGAAIMDGLASIDWAAVFGAIGGFAAEVASWAYGQIASVDWSAVWGGVADVGLYLLDKFGEIATEIATWAYDQIVAVDWAAVWDGIVDVGLYLIDKLGDITESIFTWAQTEFTEVDWSGAVGDLTETLKAAGSDLWSGVLAGVESYWDSTFSAWFTDLPQKVKDLIVDSALWLLTKGEYIMTGLIDGIENYWDSTISPYFTDTLPAAITGFFDTAIDWLEQAGNDVLQGLWDGMDTIWTDTLKPGIADVISSIITPYLLAYDWLEQAGKDVIQGLWDGAEGIWTDILKPGIANIVSSIITPFVNAYNWLKTAGGDAVQGLIDGAVGKIPGLEAVVNTLIGIWNRIPGLGNSPWPMMIGAGKDAVDGLIVGADSRMDKLNDTIGNITAAMMAPIGQTTAGTNYNGGITINVTGAGDPNAVADRVFSKFAREMALTTGGV